MRIRVALVLLALAGEARAQTAPELRGRIVDAFGAPVAVALIAIEQTGDHTWSDATGNYRLRVGGECRCTVRVSRLGYAERTLQVALRNGAVAQLDVELSMVLDSLHVAPEQRGGALLQRAQIASLHVATAGDVAATLPGVLVMQTAPGGAQHISMRGGAVGQVLVLLDGDPVNDPVTGAADLSRIPADDMESIAVLPGGHAARYGARALAGVVLITTRGAARQRQFSIGGGSLRSYATGATWSDRAGSLLWSASVHARGTNGAFRYSLDNVGDGLSGVRENADAHALDAAAALDVPLPGSTLRVRAAMQRETRGLPGKVYAPTPAARQTAQLAQLNGTWRMGSHAITASYRRQRIRIVDVSPAFGLPYDDSIRLDEVRAEAETTRSWSALSLTMRTGGRAVFVDATTLADAARRTGEFSSTASVQWRPTQSQWFAAVDARVDLDERQRQAFGSHAVTVGRHGALSLELSHRSSYAPPSLADQFFRESVGIAANPDLRAERVPSELEAALTWRGTVVGMDAQLGSTAYIADTRDLIVWEPDYRFIWSPRNTDVQRRGLDLRSDLTWHDLTLRGWFSHQRTTYSRLAGDVQVAYRPRNTAGVTIELTRGHWQARVAADYTGARNTAATNLNVLPGFWTVSSTASRAFDVRGLPLVAALRADRLFNGEDSLIYGFPLPRRTLSVELRIAHSNQSHKGQSQ